MDKLTKKQKRAITLIGTTTAVYISFKYLLPFVVPFLFAFLLAHWLSPFAQILKKHLRIPAPVTVAFTLFAIATLLLFVLVYLGQQLLLQLTRLSVHLPLYQQNLTLWLQNCCHLLEASFHLPDRSLLLLIEDAGEHITISIRTRSIPFLMSKSIPLARLIIQISTFILVVFLSTILAIGELKTLSHWKQVSVFHKELDLLCNRLGHIGGSYLKVQGFIMFLTSVICVLGLTFLGNEYALLIGIAIGLLDALPLFGTGTVFIPWILLSLISSSYTDAGILLFLYLVCYFLREIIEARLLGEKIGISPLETLASMYIGLQLFGIAGFLLGPAGLIIIKGML